MLKSGPTTNLGTQSVQIVFDKTTNSAVAVDTHPALCSLPFYNCGEERILDLAWAKFVRNVEESGWHYLDVEAWDIQGFLGSNPVLNSAGSKLVNVPGIGDGQLLILRQQYLRSMHAMGLLEGYLTCTEIAQWYENFYDGYFDGSQPPEKSVRFLSDNYDWMVEQAADRWRTDTYWLTVQAVLMQLQGVLEGVVQGCPDFIPNDSADVATSAPGPPRSPVKPILSSTGDGNLPFYEAALGINSKDSTLSNDDSNDGFTDDYYSDGNVPDADGETIDGMSDYWRGIYLPNMRRTGPSILHLLLMNANGDLFQIGEMFKYREHDEDEGQGLGGDGGVGGNPANAARRRASSSSDVGARMGRDTSDPHEATLPHDKANPGNVFTVETGSKFSDNSPQPQISHILAMNDRQKQQSEYHHKRTMKQRRQLVEDSPKQRDNQEEENIGSDHCSAIIKLLPDKSDVAFGHATWDSYQCAYPRIFKRYTYTNLFALDAAAAPAPDESSPIGSRDSASSTPPAAATAATEGGAMNSDTKRTAAGKNDKFSSDQMIAGSSRLVADTVATAVLGRSLRNRRRAQEIVEHPISDDRGNLQGLGQGLDLEHLLRGGESRSTTGANINTDTDVVGSPKKENVTKKKEDAVEYDDDKEENMENEKSGEYGINGVKIDVKLGGVLVDAMTRFSVLFSSNPGMMASIDDFYVISAQRPSGSAQRAAARTDGDTAYGTGSRSSGAGSTNAAGAGAGAGDAQVHMAVMETSLSTYNTSLYDLIHPHSVLCWMRARVANQFAQDGQHWARLFSRYHSGTYANQWMVLDFAKFNSFQDPKPGFFTVLEEIPGYIEYRDMTDTLIEQSYWPSYNEPYFPEVIERSGAGELCRTNPDAMCYASKPRAKLFDKLQSDILGVTDLQWVLQYNHFETDPLSQNDSCHVSLHNYTPTILHASGLAISYSAICH